MRVEADRFLLLCISGGALEESEQEEGEFIRRLVRVEDAAMESEYTMRVNYGPPAAFAPPRGTDEFTEGYRVSSLE